LASSCENGTEPSGLTKAGNFFFKWESIRFLRWTLPHGVDMFCEAKLYRVFHTIAVVILVVWLVT
jgi:hypothetical protein